MNMMRPIAILAVVLVTLGSCASDITTRGRVGVIYAPISTDTTLTENLGNQSIPQFGSALLIEIDRGQPRMGGCLGGGYGWSSSDAEATALITHTFGIDTEWCVLGDI